MEKRVRAVHDAEKLGTAEMLNEPVGLLCVFCVFNVVLLLRFCSVTTDITGMY